MQRRFAWAGGMILGTGLMILPPAAQAVISRLTPLREVLGAEQLIFMSRVAAVDPIRPSLVLQVEEDLKGKTPFRKLTVNLTGDSEGIKEHQSTQLLKRMAADLPVVVFTSKRGKRYTAFGYTNGTWFQMIGHVDPDEAATVRWGFTHCEPYLRRTFKGPTADLRQTIIDGLKGTKPPPEPDEKEKPGLGPELPAKKDSGRSSAVPPAAGAGRGPLFAVIPTVIITGPLAILALLFPALFGGVLLVLRRWLVLLTVASTNSTLYMTRAWFARKIDQTWWGSALALWIVMSLVTLAGAVWALLRHRAAVKSGQVTVLPRGSEQLALWLLSLAGFGVLIVGLIDGGARQLLNHPWNALCAIGAVAWVGTLYTVYLRLSARHQSPGKPVLPTEGIMLWALVFASAGVAALNLPRDAAAVGFQSADTAAADGGKSQVSRQTVVWTFKPDDPGFIGSTPWVAGGRVYVSAAHQAGLTTSYGAVYCLDQAAGAVLWAFNDEGEMKQVYSSPCLADGRVYVGEGFHQHRDCKLYCLDAASGRKIWGFQTTSHTESSPCVVDGRVYFGAGDDGVYCLDAKTGQKLWHFEGLHVDTNPAVVGKRLYAGSGYGNYTAFALDTDTGKPAWQVQTDLPVFGSPTVAGEQVFFGIGNGDLLVRADKPAGAVLCLEARTGSKVWRYDVPDAVHVRPVVDGDWVYFGSRDQSCYCLGRQEGRLRWKQPVGDWVVESPALAGSRLYVVASSKPAYANRLYCLAADSGQVQWTFDVAHHANVPRVEPLSPVTVIVGRDATGEYRRIYFGAGLNTLTGLQPALYCLDEHLEAR